MDKSTEPRRDPTLMGTEMPRGSTPGPLRHLSELDDYEIVDGEPDIRGWGVRGSDGVRIGEVKDLIVDCGSLDVRYMQVELDNDLTADNDERQVLLPLGTARLNDDEDVVLLRSASSEVANIAPYRIESNRDLDDQDLWTRYGQGVTYDNHAMDAFFGTRRFGRGRDSYLRRR